MKKKEQSIRVKGQVEGLHKRKRYFAENQPKDRGNRKDSEEKAA